jgi:hypothetical protein
MFAERNSNYIQVLRLLSTAELIEAYEKAKQHKLSDEFQEMLNYALKLRETEKKTED